ncbi:MAG TPA: hypothetical protein VL325_01870 [Pyrinomonadaceae bacterium]|nr:hypothetical protein [Pyrinomonadaceae bacterium]
MAANNSTGTAFGLRDIQSGDPHEDTGQIKDALKQLSEHVRLDVGKVKDQRARALFETTAEVLDGLHNAYEHFETRAEDAWK